MHIAVRIVSISFTPRTYDCATNMARDLTGLIKASDSMEKTSLVITAGQSNHESVKQMRSKKSNSGMEVS